MSDTEEGTFDKEAEKEKLREQLRAEEESRRTTQHMSELLLKGATMTNKHCDTCGDPLFRYEGREFCPTCSQADAGGAGGAVGDAAEGATTATQSQPGAGGQAGGTAEQDSAGIDRVDAGAPSETTTTPAATGSSASETAASGAASQRPATQQGGAVTPTAGGAAGDAAGDVAGARAALARKLATLARQAEATEDVGRSRELLSAAREAAEALAAIDRVGR